MIGVGEALNRVLSEVKPGGSEQIALPHASGRVLSHQIASLRDVPSFRNSAMDGFAVRGSELTSASVDGPVRLEVIETVGAGVQPTRFVETGTAVRIMTGAMLPAGADTVVRVEDTTSDETSVLIRTATPPGTSVRHPGEDVRCGEIVFEPGRVLRPADIGVLASIGISLLSVARRPRVAIVTTGDELVDLGEPLAPGQIVNSNAYTLAASVEEAGAIPTVLRIARDSEPAIAAVFAEAFTADLVLSTGGVSAGNFDFVRDVLRREGYEERFWKVAQKPGKPLTFGMRGSTPVFGLPGNPVSALVCFYVYVLPALRKVMHRHDLHLRTVEATLGEDLTKTEGLTEFIRCAIDTEGTRTLVKSTGTQSSGVLRSMSLGDGLLIGPPAQTILTAGACCRVLLLNDARGTAVSPFID